MAEAFDLTCAVTIGQLPQYLDDALPERRLVRFEQHIVVCPGCSTYLAQLRRTAGAVAALRGAQRRDRVWEKIAGRLPGDGDAAPESSRDAAGDQVVAYKFLGADGVSRFARVRWPEPGDGWVRAQATAGICRGAVHACGTWDLAYWLDERLWRVELAGEVVVAPSKLAASRGRLLGAVQGWPEASPAFIEYCKTRLGQLQSLAEQRRNGRAAGFLKSYADELHGDTDPASVSYTVAHAAETVGWTREDALAESAHGADNPFDAERRGQSRWLADRLGLAGSGHA